MSEHHRADSATPVLSIAGLVTGYGASHRVLDGVDLLVRPQSVVTVLGSNGAGKSTLLRAISGTLGLHGGTIESGEITFEGERIDKIDPAAIVKAGVVQAPEGRQVFTRMSVEENLRAGAHTIPKSEHAAARDRVFELFPRLADRRGQRAGLLSGGEQQMLAIGRALMSHPKLLLLDEPSLGLAPKLVQQIGQIVTEINEQGTAVVLVEQNATMAMRVAHHAVVLEVGSVALSGTVSEFEDSDEIARLYLGGHAESAEQAETEVRKAASVRHELSRWGG